MIVTDGILQILSTSNSRFDSIESLFGLIDCLMNANDADRFNAACYCLHILILSGVISVNDIDDDIDGFDIFDIIYCLFCLE